MSGASLHLHQVARRFGRRWAVGGIDLDVRSGEGIALVGHNGSGKSTLLRCLATALRTHHGSILMDGRELWAHRSELRHHIGFLSHAGYLYDDLSGAENLRVWGRLGGHPVDPPALLERVGLSPTRREPVRTYSAGMRRRLALARLMLHKPRLVLLDEPYSALDAEGRDLVTTIARQLREEGATLLMATHLTHYAASVCDRQVEMRDGKLHYDGPIDGSHS